MSPEIFEEQPFDGHAVDVWALGPLLFILVTGQQPWAFPNSSNECFRYISQGGLESLLDHWNVNLSPSLVNLLQNMFFVDPRHRLSLAQIRAHPWIMET